VTRLPDLDPETVDPERRALLEQITDGRGRLPTPYRVWIASPELARLLHPLGRFLAGGTSLSTAEAEVAILAAARQWHAEYVLAVHARQARAAGLPEEVINALVTGAPVRPADERQRAVADTMVALAAPDPVPDEVHDRVVGLLGRAAVAEMLALAGYFSAVALAMKFFEVTPPAT
jgi:4-carboxymuconolactone decarboxylase